MQNSVLELGVGVTLELSWVRNAVLELGVTLQLSWVRNAGLELGVTLQLSLVDKDPYVDLGLSTLHCILCLAVIPRV